MRPDGNPFWNVASIATAWVAFFGLAFLHFRGTLVLLELPVVQVTFLSFCVFLGVNVALALRVYERLRERLPPQRLLWLLPLGDFTLCFLVLFLIVGMPSWFGRHDFWKDLTGIPPTPFTRLVTTSFILSGFQMVYLFVCLARRFLADLPSMRLSGVDTMTSLACSIGFVAVPLVVIFGRVVLPQNVSYVRGWISLGFSQYPQEAMEHFRRVVEDYPDSDLADSSLFRMSRIEIDVLGHPANGEAMLVRLIDRYPCSPIIDDALFNLGELYLRSPARPELAIATFRKLLGSFPGSYLSERASLGLAKALLQKGKDKEALAAIRDLEQMGARRFVVGEEPDGEIWVCRFEAMVDNVLGKNCRLKDYDRESVRLIREPDRSRRTPAPPPERRPTIDRSRDGRRGGRGDI